MDSRRITQMDSISLLGPPQPKQPLNQEDFDARFGHVRNVRKITGTRLSKTLSVGIKSAKRIPLPFFRWLHRYSIREDGPRDALGSLLLSALLLPQGLGIGLLIDDLGGGVLSVILSQLVYCLLGSGKHSSLGSLSHVAFLIYSSLQYSDTNLTTLSFYTGLIQLLLFFLPTRRVYSLISHQLLTGFSLGILLRFLIFSLPRFVPLTGCSYINLCVDDFIKCFLATHWQSAVLALAAGGLSLIFHLKLNVLANEKLGFTLPHELFILVSLSLVCSQFGFEDPQITKNLQIFEKSRIALPGLPTTSILVDSLAIALFGAASHLYSMTDFKCNHLRKKQELLVLSLSSLISALFSLPSPFSSPRNSQVNAEALKHSLLSNIISSVILLISCAILTYTLQYFPSPVVAAVALTSFPNLLTDLITLQGLAKKSPCDLVSHLLFKITLFPCPDTRFLHLRRRFSKYLPRLLDRCLDIPPLCGYLAPSDVLIKVSDNFYVEENRYRECECPDTPLRIIRFSGPMLFINSLQLRKAIYDQVVVVKGLIGVGLGSRTVSLRSCGGPGAIGPKESMTGRSGTNIVITHDGDRPSLPAGDNIVRFIVLDLHGVTGIDMESMQMLIQVFRELSNDHIRLFFVGLNASVRDQMERADFHSNVPLSHLYPTLSEALTAARNISLPFHMSVSMNGYRDVIALSTTGSHNDISISRYSPEAV